MIVDSHVHSSTVWWEPVEVHLFHMDRNDVERAVLIQFWGQTDNEYHFDAQRRYPGRFANVVYVDWTQKDAIARLEELAERGASGVRLRPGARSSGDDPLAIWRAAGRLDLTVDCGGAFFKDENDETFFDLVRAVPDVRIVIEHLGGANKPDSTEAQRALRRRAMKLAQFPNVTMKIHGLGEFAERAMPPGSSFPFKEPIPPLLEDVYQAFGPQRMMWGSDYPNTSHREGYTTSLVLCRDRFSDKPKAEIDLIFGGVAQRMFFHR